MTTTAEIAGPVVAAVTTLNVPVYADAVWLPALVERFILTSALPAAAAGPTGFAGITAAVHGAKTGAAHGDNVWRKGRVSAYWDGR